MSKLEEFLKQAKVDYYNGDPSISDEDTWKRYYGDRGDHNLPEYYPPLNAFFFKIYFYFF